MVFGKEHDDSLEPYLPNKLENHQETAHAMIQWVSGGGDPRHLHFKQMLQEYLMRVA